MFLLPLRNVALAAVSVSSSADPPPTNAQSTWIVFPKTSLPCSALIASCASDFFLYSMSAYPLQNPVRVSKLTRMFLIGPYSANISLTSVMFEKVTMVGMSANC